MDKTRDNDQVRYTEQKNEANKQFQKLMAFFTPTTKGSSREKFINNLKKAKEVSQEKLHTPISSLDIGK